MYDIRWMDKWHVWSIGLSLLLLWQPLGSSGNALQQCCATGGLCVASRCPVLSVTEESDLDTTLATMTFTLNTQLAIVGDAFGTTLFKLDISSTSSATVASLKVKSRIDAEITPQIVTVRINMKDDASDTNVDVTVLITDINDNNETFSLPVYQCQILENTPNSVCGGIELMDRDSMTVTPTIRIGGADASAAEFELKILTTPTIPNWQNNHPRPIVKWTMEVVVKTPIDYEKRKFFSLSLLATDPAGKTASAQLMITVKDFADQPPVFTTTNTDAVVPENAEAGYKVIQVNAQDGDQGIRNPITYAIASSPYSSYFQVNSTTGEITLKQTIDREVEPFVSTSLVVFSVTASEETATPQPANITSSTIQIRVTIQDVNDFVPTFNRASYTFNVMEDTQKNIPLSVPAGGSEIEVEDKDKGKSGEFNISLVKDDSPFTVFRPSSNLVFNKATILLRVENSTALDYETVRSFSFQIVAVDQADPYHSASAAVLVNVQNMNDNQPQFAKHRYNFNVSENSPDGTFVGEVTATDSDDGVYGQITYSLVGGSSTISKFHVNATTGVITVAADANLNREGQTYFYFNLMAQDSGGLTALTQIQITVTDVNDNAPMFANSLYLATVNEGETSLLGSTLFIVATDVDQGPDNNAIEYSITAGNTGGHFGINASTGELLVEKAVDYETLPAGHANGIFNLTVQAKDKGKSGTSLSSTTTVQITVEDKNDQTPVFESNYSREINETWPAGSPVVQVHATDGDKPGSPQAQVFYRIGSGAGDQFSINSTSGLISVESHTRVKVGKYTLTVLAVDRGATAKTGTTLVTIVVGDVNNKAPFFPSELVRHPVDENATVKSVLYNFTATDPDADANLVYAIDKSRMSAKFGRQTVDSAVYDFRNLFSINNHGQVILEQPLDREKADSINIPITVTDTAAISGTQTASGELIIIVEDVNDEFPKFLHLNGSVYVLTVPESLAKDQYTSLTVQASDGDDSDRITYSLVDATNTFDVESTTGRIKLLKALNYETTKRLNFTVKARDAAGHVTEAKVLVTVADYNDNAPTFVVFPTPVTVAENTTINTTVVRISASDEDSSEAAVIEFSILSGAAGKFRVEPETTNGHARIVLSGSLDHDVAGGKEYSLMIEAKDNPSGSTRLRVSQVMTIIVSDINDNSPVFAHASYSANTTESANNGTQLELVSASDADSGLNAELSYSLEGSGDFLALFGVDTVVRGGQRVGAVVTRKSMAHAAGCYTGHVVASDGGSPSQSARVQIDICVEDVNDYSPEFVVPNNTNRVVYINETAVNQLLITVEAHDRDPVGANKQVRYQLESSSVGAAKFSLNATSGELRNVQSLDREAQSVYNLVVRAYDLGKPSRSSTTTVTVEVIDLNDNAASFPTADFVQTLSIPENAALDVTLPTGVKGRLIGNVSQAHDADDGANKIICYFIVNQYFSFLYLDKDTGLLYTTRVFDREDAGGSTLTVVIKAVGPNFCSSTFYTWQPTSTTRRRLLFLNNNPIPYDPTDRTLSKVIIEVGDVNDNPPVFEVPSFFLGVPLDSPPNTEIQNFKTRVMDADSSSSSSLRFSIDGDVTISEPLKSELAAANINSVFVLHPTSGILTTAGNVYFAKQMVGYFSFKVKVEDGTFSAMANCTVYLLTPEQQVIAVFRDSPANVGAFSAEFVRFLSNITRLSVNKDSIITHRDKDGMHDSGKTDMYLHAYDPDTQKIISANALIVRLDSVDQTSLTTLYNKYNVMKVTPVVSAVTDSSMENVFRIALVVTACCLGFLLIVCCFCLWSCRHWYRRKLKSANVAAYGAANGRLGGIPGTTIDTYDGSPWSSSNKYVVNANSEFEQGPSSNPIWLEHYDNWAMHNDVTSDKESVVDEDLVEDFNPFASGPSTNLDNTTPPQPAPRRRLADASLSSDSASGSQGVSNFAPLSSRPPPLNGVPTLLGIVPHPSVTQMTAI